MRVVRKSQNGYVLLMVLGVLAVMAFVIGRFAERNDQLRRNALDLTQYADGRVAVSSALAATLYWNATRPLTPVPARPLSRTAYFCARDAPLGPETAEPSLRRTSNCLILRLLLPPRPLRRTRNARCA